MTPAVADFCSPVSEGGWSGFRKGGGAEGGLVRTRQRRPRLIKVRRRQGPPNDSKGEDGNVIGIDRGRRNGEGNGEESVGKENCGVWNGGSVTVGDDGGRGVLAGEGFGNWRSLDVKLKEVEFVFGVGGRDAVASKGKGGSRAARKMAIPVKESDEDNEGAFGGTTNLGFGSQWEGEEVGYSGFNFKTGVTLDEGAKCSLYNEVTDRSGDEARIGSSDGRFSHLPDSLDDGGESVSKVNVREVNNTEESGKTSKNASNEQKNKSDPIGHSGYVFGSSWSSDLNVEAQKSWEYSQWQDSVHYAQERLGTSEEPQNGGSENLPLNCSKGPEVFIFKGNMRRSSDQGKIRTSSDRPTTYVGGHRSRVIYSDDHNSVVNENIVSHQDNAHDANGIDSIFDLPKGLHNLSLHECQSLDSIKRTDTSASDLKSRVVLGNDPALLNPVTVSSGDLNTHTAENPFVVESGGFGNIRKDTKNGDKDLFVFGRTSDIAGDSGDVLRYASFTFQAEASECTGRGNYPCTANVFDASAHRVEEKVANVASSASPLGGLDVPNFDASCLKPNLFSEQKLHFSRYAKQNTGKKAKRKNRRVRSHSSEKLAASNQYVPGTSGFSEDRGTPSYSPMDSSPYQETAAEGTDVSAATLGRADGPTGQSRTFLSSLSINKDGTSVATASPNSEDHGDVFNGKETIHVAENGRCIPENADRKTTTSKDQFVFASGSGKLDQQTFIFSSSSSAHVSTKDRKKLCKKKNKVPGGRANSAISLGRSVVGCGISCTQSSRIPDASPTSGLNWGEDKCAFSEVEGGERVNLDNIRNKGQKNSLATSAIQEACDKWRIRGNQSYNCGNFAKAEEFYTNGINAVPSDEKSVCGLKPLLLCYSNRAASRVSLGRIREAIEDCLMASALDRDFLKVQLRAANCHLLLGEVGDASAYFNKCLVSGADVCLDRKLIIDAADGLQKAKKVAEWMNASSIILEEKTTDAASKVVEIVSEALSISKFSEKLFELKAEALQILRQHEEVIQLCQKSLSFSELNFPAVGITEGCFLPKLWRFFFMAKSHFCLGRLEEALHLLEKVQQFGSSCDKLHLKYLKSSISLATNIRKMQQCKTAGNEAFHSGKYAEAVEHYSNALLCNIESRSFVAVCFCNRAASFQALGQITDAIADCSVAIALDGKYTKAISRRATLHELIRDYGQASADIQRLVSVLETQITKSSTSGSGDNKATELRKARQRRSALEEEAKNGGSLDYYLILGVKLSDSASDIKKAYHKAALRHHPDKAGQLLSRSDNCSEGRLWKEISKDIYDDADRLFKLIGEAYAVLSDPSKKSQYDNEEEMKKAREGRDRGSGPSKFNASPSGRSARRQGRENWRTYGYSDSRW
ncbi:hypothetical protein MLD38_020128 [Melastoma candidum]|uniref:Uncharacterized protein n=1 Tax=Melastoma candidum TaxID=119954 RepID=A0ACB9QFQ7_9MYRT|nr:hypothetical protein MLD38_020128 [Melastoma candidum]